MSEARARFPVSYISPELRLRLDAAAEKLDISTSQYVLQILNQHMEMPESPKKQEKQKAESRPDAWARAAGEATAALDELVNLQGEYESWKDNLPENLQNSPLGEKLEEVCNIDLQSALDVAQEAEGMDLPRGFGRD